MCEDRQNCKMYMNSSIIFVSSRVCTWHCEVSGLNKGTCSQRDGGKVAMSSVNHQNNG
jgi:hypothetical protein